MGSSTPKTSSSASSNSLSSSPVMKLASESPSPPIHKAFSFPTPLVHNPPARKGNNHHLVSLTSTSYGLSPPQILLRPRDASSYLNRRQEHVRSGLTRVDST
ncbi:hypothetical protein Bca52824_038248 [Brassica carinata]|uniref:Uncharacterized protein n=1 Tax=Brassica carinata TaxID=52824 RepID=A0A8X7RTS0_BRACI|nr:hypothetical protein Bca52824_038248 [Brassica carinata]